MKMKIEIMNMKKLMVAALGIMAAISANAQKAVVGMRMEVAEAETTNSSFTIFTYKDSDDDSSFGYYLGLGREFHLSEITETTDIVGDLNLLSETCICLGSTYDEAYATLDSILVLYDRDVDTAVRFPARAATGGERLGKPSTATCVVKKKPLLGKRLLFQFVSGRHQAETYLSKTVVKELRMGMKFDKKLHPKQHR